MSCFLFYFETNNPNASWDSFNRKISSTLERFNDINSRFTERLSLSECSIDYQSKIYKGFIIHDGISSDKIFSSKNSTQLEILNTFLEASSSIESIIPNFLLKLHNEKYFDRIIINDEIKKEQIKISNINFELKKDILYSLNYNDRVAASNSSEDKKE
ncbi:MAG: hypothetical protein HWD82_06435 [Flavobacteriaceae bacterium]|nr:hypothetical protein [Flavobacteriaceae bacterium]